jgi:hypothetical protein
MGDEKCAQNFNGKLVCKRSLGKKEEDRIKLSKWFVNK